MWSPRKSAKDDRHLTISLKNATPKPVMWFRGCQNAVALTRGETWRSNFAGGLSCVSCVRTKAHMSTRTSVQGYRVWMTTHSASFISVILRPYHIKSPLSPDKTCYLVMLLAKVLPTEVHMSSQSSVQNHWRFEHYLQNLCLPVLDAVRNRTKIVPWSFPMSLFLWFTVWSSLLILRMSWPAAADALNSWPSRLWSLNSSPPPSPNPHASWENQGIWLWNGCLYDMKCYTTALRPLVTNPFLGNGKIERRKLRGRHVFCNLLGRVFIRAFSSLGGPWAIPGAVQADWCQYTLPSVRVYEMKWNVWSPTSNDQMNWNEMKCFSFFNSGCELKMHLFHEFHFISPHFTVIIKLVIKTHEREWRIISLICISHPLLKNE
jgi:hypothetical protein